MKRNLMFGLQQRSRSTFLKCRAPSAVARSPAANGRSPQPGPPTAAPPAVWGAAALPSARAQPHVARPSGVIPNHAGQVPWPPSPDRPAARSHQINRLPLVVVRKRPPFTTFHSTPLGSASLLQVPTNSEEAHYPLLRQPQPQLSNAFQGPRR